MQAATRTLQNPVNDALSVLSGLMKRSGSHINLEFPGPNVGFDGRPDYPGRPFQGVGSMFALPPPPIDDLLGQPRPQDSLSDGTPEPPKSDSLVPCAAAAGSVAPSSVVQVSRVLHKPSLEEMLKTMQEHLQKGAPQKVPKEAPKKKAASGKHKKSKPRSTKNTAGSMKRPAAAIATGPGCSKCRYSARGCAKCR